MLKTVGNPSTRYGDQTIVGGNLVIGTAGKGIDFSAASSAAGMTSELLSDYEEGTFTPVLSALTGAITSYTASGRYTKIGRQVLAEIKYEITDNGTGADNGQIAGLPYVPALGAAAATRVDGTTGRTAVFRVIAANSSGIIKDYANAYPWATNASGTINLVYSV